MFQEKIQSEKEIMNQIEKQLKKNADFLWLYDITKGRKFTYEELYQKRNISNYKDQKFSVIKNPESVEFLEEFRQEALDNPDFYKIDYKNIKRYIEAPWPEEVNMNQIGTNEEDDYQSSEDIESIPEELRVR